MKIFPVITAAIVCVVLYFVILDRQALVEFSARFGTVEETSDTPEPTPEADTVADDAAQDSAVRVTVRRSEAQITQDAVVLRGRTEALRQVDVAAETSGRIVSEPIRAGAFVEAGQLLCRIATGTRDAALAEARARLIEAQARLPEAAARLPEARARLAEAEAAVLSAQLERDAAENLSQSGFASETRAASANAALASAQAAVESATAGVQSSEAGVEGARSGVLAAEAGVIRAEEELDRLEIVAPFDGLLESDTAELGALMAPGAHCATVIQLDPIKLVGFVPEAQVDRIAVGSRAGARLATGTEVTGEVTFLSRSADPQTRTFRVEILVPNGDLAIRDGQTADILVSTDGTAAHLLPASAMTLNDDGDLGVRVVEDGTARFLPATILRDTANGVWLAELPEAIEVITVGQEFVTDGTAVIPTYEELTQ